MSDILKERIARILALETDDGWQKGCTEHDIAFIKEAIACAKEPDAFLARRLNRICEYAGFILDNTMHLVRPFKMDRTDMEHFEWYFNEAAELTEKRWPPPPGAHAHPDDWRIGNTTSVILFIGELHEQLQARPDDDDLSRWLKTELEAVASKRRTLPPLFNQPTYLNLVLWWETRAARPNVTLTDFCNQFEKRN